MPDPAYRYVYAANPVRVIDGVTVVLDVDLGYDAWLRSKPHRLVGINARQLHQPGGPEARDNLAAVLAGQRLTITSFRPAKDGDRYLADVSLDDGQHLGALLVAGGWAAPWNGRGARPIPPWPRQVR